MVLISHHCGFTLLKHCEVGLPIGTGGLVSLADHLGMGRAGDAQARLAEDGDSVLAAENRSTHLGREVLYEVEVEVGTTNALELTVDDDRHGQSGQPHILA